MSDPNIITAYSWAAGIFQQILCPSLTDAEKRAELVYEINTPLVKGTNGSSTVLKIWIPTTKTTALIK